METPTSTPPRPGFVSYSQPDSHISYKSLHKLIVVMGIVGTVLWAAAAVAL